MANPFLELVQRAGRLLPALIGAVIGVGVFLPTFHSVSLSIIVIAIVVPISARLVGEVQIATSPVFARWLIEAWIVFTIGIAALGAAVGLWISLGLDLKPWASPTIRPDDLKDVNDVLKSALIGFVAGVLTKELADGIGPLTVEHQFKSAMASSSKRLHAAPNPAPPLIIRQILLNRFVEAVHFGNIGWGFSARGKRAAALANWLRTGAVP